MAGFSGTVTATFTAYDENGRIAATRRATFTVTGTGTSAISITSATVTPTSGAGNANFTFRANTNVAVNRVTVRFNNVATEHNLTANAARTQWTLSRAMAGFSGTVTATFAAYDENGRIAATRRATFTVTDTGTLAISITSATVTPSLGAHSNTFTFRANTNVAANRVTVRFNTAPAEHNLTANAARTQWSLSRTMVGFLGNVTATFTAYDATGRIVATRQASFMVNTAEVNTSFEQEVLRLTNTERANHGLRPLEWDSRLGSAARSHSADMARRDFFSHTTPEGITFNQRITRAGFSWRLTGENIARGQTMPEAVVRSWMNSPGQRANILDSDFTHLGVGFDQNHWTQKLQRQEMPLQFL
jgi:uncharacterized protein YkwD